MYIYVNSARFTYLYVELLNIIYLIHSNFFTVNVYNKKILFASKPKNHFAYKINSILCEPNSQIYIVFVSWLSWQRSSLGIVYLSIFHQLKPQKKTKMKVEKLCLFHFIIKF